MKQDLLLSITKNCETPIGQTQRKAEETLEYKMTKPRETFHFNPPIPIKGDWVIGLTDLEVYNSIYKITKKLKLYTDVFDEFKFVELKDELEEIFNLEEITHKNLQDDILGPFVIKFYKKIKTRKVKHCCLSYTIRKLC